jgi:hypothetical protein
MRKLLSYISDSFQSLEYHLNLSPYKMEDSNKVLLPFGERIKREITENMIISLVPLFSLLKSGLAYYLVPLAIGSITLNSLRLNKYKA